MHESTTIQRALLTVYDKTNIIPLAEALHLQGIALLSTGNTAALLQSHGLPVTTVNDYTGFPEIMGGRVKTLHPKIHGGILGRRDVDADVMIEHDIQDIDLVVVNLYPFETVSRNPCSSLEDTIENIDIGGPTLIRGAAKNYEWCTVLVDPNDYREFLQELETNHGAIGYSFRFRCAAKAFLHTAHYDNAISTFFAQNLQDKNNDFKESLSLQYTLKEKLRYGENPHQQGAFYVEPTPAEDSIANATQHQGKDLSFNNIIDADCALECVKSFEEPTCVIVKHANPCGVATAGSLQQAYEKAYLGDPISAFGGIIAFNQTVDDKIIQALFEKQFCEVIIAPQFTPLALQAALLKPNCRLLQYHPSSSYKTDVQREIKSVNGGILVQSCNKIHLDKLNIVTKREPTALEMQDLLFSFQVVNFVKSNAIVYAKAGQTLGIGAGQMSRIFSTEIAAMKAKASKLSLQGAVMASDAFFPFKDNIEKAHEYGISAIIQPGGSVRDSEVIECADALGLAMVFTGIRCFRH